MTSTKPFGYRPDVDGLRAIAILGVVAYHIALPGVRGGFTGVDVFFVISGFLITQLLLKQVEQTGTVSLAEFYSRRIRRLLPAFTIVMVTTLVLGVFLLPPFGEKQDLAKAACAAVVFLANQYFLSTTGGYFSGPSESFPLLHLWSLSVEEQFYVLWPLLLILTARLSRPESRLRSARVAILILVGMSFLVSSWLLERNPQAAFYIFPSRAWELGIGAFLATIRFQPNSVYPLTGNIAGLLGLLMIGGGMFGISGGAPFPGYRGLAPVVGTTLVLLGGSLAPVGIVTRSLSFRPLVAIGLVSYGWYLWHWPLLSFARFHRLFSRNFWVDVGTVLFALGLATISFRLVERPIRHGSFATTAPNRVVLFAGAATLALLASLSGAFGAWAKFGPQNALALKVLDDRSPLQAECLVSSTWDGAVFRESCRQKPQRHDDANVPLLVLWGDSQADAWSSGVRAVTDLEGAESRQVTMAVCPPLVGLVPSLSFRWPRGRPECRAFNEAVTASLSLLRKREPERSIGVIMVARWPAYSGYPTISFRTPEGWAYDFRNTTETQNLASLRSALTVTLDSLKQLDIRVLIILGQPEYRIAPIRCQVAGLPATNCDQSRPELDTYRRKTSEVIRAVSGSFGNVRVIDPLEFFCDATTCPAFIADRPMAYDDCHLSASASIAFAPNLRPDIHWLVSKPMNLPDSAQP